MSRGSYGPYHRLEMPNQRIISSPFDHYHGNAHIGKVGLFFKGARINISTLQALCAWNSPVTGEFPTQRSVTRSFDVFFDLRLNKRLSQQSWGWWFETQSCPLWRHFNWLKPWRVAWDIRYCNKSYTHSETSDSGVLEKPTLFEIYTKI